MTDFVQSRLGAAKPEEHLPEVEPVLNRRSYQRGTDYDIL